MKVKYTIAFICPNYGEVVKGELNLKAFCYKGGFEGRAKKFE